MKHFSQFIHLLRSAWDGDRTRCLEQAHALAERMEGEGDTAHARMLRFTLQSLQSQVPAPDMRTTMVKTGGALSAPTLGIVVATSVPAAPENAEHVSLTFGRWDSAGAQRS